MRKSVATTNIFFYFFLLLVSALLSYLLIIPNYFPYLGIGLFFTTLSSFVLILKKNKSVYLWFLYGLLLLFSTLIFYRSNPFLIFLNTIAVFYLGSFLVLTDKKNQQNYNFIILPLTIFFQSLREKNKFKYPITNIAQSNLKKLSNRIISTTITVLIMLIIIPLLAYSNPFFNQLVTNFINILHLPKLIDFFLKESFFIHLARTLLFFSFALFIPRLLTYSTSFFKQPSIAHFSLPTNSLLMSKIVTSFILVIFFITQAQLYFASAEILKISGYSQSQSAREIFAQLSIVSLISFGLIYFDRLKNKWSKSSTYLLIAEAIFLNFIALKSVYDYSFNWGLTHKRLYGFSVVVWIFGLFMLLLYQYLRDLNNFKFIKNLLLWSCFIVLAVNILNFDYLIYHYAKTTTREGIDHRYLSRLSTDAHSYSEHLQQLMIAITASEKTELKQIQAAWTLINKIEKLKTKYNNLDIRAINFSEYFEYLRVRNLDLETYKKTLNSKQLASQTSNQVSFNSEIKLKSIELDRSLITSKTVAPLNVRPTITKKLTSLNITPTNIKTIKIKIINLDQSLYNHNFEVKQIENNETIAKGSLDNDSFNHSYGFGKFSVILYDYIIEKNIVTAIPSKEIFYEIKENEQVIKLIDTVH